MAQESARPALPLVLGALAAAAMALLFAWLFSLEGTRGLYEWGGIRGLFLGCGALGLLPLALALSGLALARSGSRMGSAGSPGAASRRRRASLARALGLAASLLSAPALATALGLGGFIYLSSRRLSPPLPALKLVNPAEGLLPRGPAGDSGPLLRLSLSSDPHWGAASSRPSAREAVLRGVAAARPARDAFFILGDNVERGMEEGPWREEALSLASILPDTPLRPILGNHDTIVDGAYHFRKYFFDRGGSDSGSPFYYSIEAGPATIVVLHLPWGAETLDGAQRAWLEGRLASVPRERPLLVLSHAFVLSSGYVDEDTGKAWYDSPELAAYLCPLFERSGVDLVVSGHNHYMELLERNGVRYALVGAMGGLPDPEPSYLSPYQVWLKAGSFGRLDLDIDARGLALRFVDVSGAVLREDYLPASP